MAEMGRKVLIGELGLEDSFGIVGSDTVPPLPRPPGSRCPPLPLLGTVRAVRRGTSSSASLMLESSLPESESYDPELLAASITGSGESLLLEVLVPSRAVREVEDEEDGVGINVILRGFVVASGLVWIAPEAFCMKSFMLESGKKKTLDLICDVAERYILQSFAY